MQFYQEIYSTSGYEYKNGIWLSSSSNSYHLSEGNQEFSIGHCYLDSIQGNNFKIHFIRSEQSKISLNPKWSQLKKIILKMGGIIN